MEPKKIVVKSADITVSFDIPGLLKASQMFKDFAEGKLATLEISTDTQKIIFTKI